MPVTAIDVTLQYSRAEDPQFRRNAAVALGALEDARAIGRLIEMADSQREQHPDVRRAAIGALAGANGTMRHEVQAPIVRALCEDRDGMVLREALRVLSEHRASVTAAELAVGLATLIKRPSPDLDIRLRALELLGDVAGDPSAFDHLVDIALDHESAAVREKALARLADRLGGERNQTLAIGTAPKPDEYIRLARLRRLGLACPVMRLSWRERLGLAAKARDAVGPEGEMYGQLGLRSAGWVAGSGAAVGVWLGLVAFLPLPLNPTDGTWFLAKSIALVLVTCWLVPWLAQPAGRVPDRVAGALVELTRLIPPALLAAATAAVAERVVFPTDTANGLLWVIGCVVFVTILAIRAGSLLAYGVAPRGTQFGVEAVVASLVGIAACVTGLVAVGAFAAWEFMPRLVELGLIGIAPCVAVAVAVARLDTSIDDRSFDPRILRRMTVAAIALPGFVGLGWTQYALMARPQVSILRAGAVAPGRDGRYTFTVPVGAKVPMELDFAQVATFELDDTVGLRIIVRGPQTVVVSNRDSGIPRIDRRYLQAGHYVVRVASGFRDAEEALLTIDDACERITRHLLPTWTSPKASEDNEDTDQAPEFVRLSVFFNLRGVNENDRRAARDFELEVKETLAAPVDKSANDASRTHAAPASGVTYAVAMKDVEGGWQAGSIVRCLPGAGASYAPKTGERCDLVYGWHDGGEAQPATEELTRLRGRPSDTLLANAASFNRIASETEAPLHATPLASELRRQTPMVEQLEKAGDWARLDDAGDREFSETIFFFAGSPDQIRVLPGSMLRGAKWDSSILAWFQLIDGIAAGSSSSPYYLLRKSETVLLGRRWDQTQASSLREWRSHLPVDPGWSDARVVADDHEPPPPSPLASKLSDPRETVEGAITAAGDWLKQYQVQKEALKPPDVFSGYFLVAKASNSFAVGSIVRGSAWDTDGVPEFEVVYGWNKGDADDKQYVRSEELTYLGPKFQPQWSQLAEALHDPTDSFRLVDHRSEAGVTTPR